MGGRRDIIGWNLLVRDYVRGNHDQILTWNTKMCINWCRCKMWWHFLFQLDLKTILTSSASENHFFPTPLEQSKSFLASEISYSVLILLFLTRFSCVTGCLSDYWLKASTHAECRVSALETSTKCRCLWAVKFNAVNQFSRFRPKINYLLLKTYGSIASTIEGYRSDSEQRRFSSVRLLVGLLLSHICQPDKFTDKPHQTDTFLSDDERNSFLSW